ncbi:unnamed protein product [Ophioblennius macclurei]
MSAPGSESSPVEDNLAVQDGEGGLPNVPFSAPPASIPSSTPPFPTAAKPSFTIEAASEGKAVSVASNECCSAVSSPAEGSPAKPADTSTFNGAAQTSPPASHMASASDSLEHTATDLLDVSEPQPCSSLSPSPELGDTNSGNEHPRVLTLNGVSVTLDNDNVWKKFDSYGTEMILSKPGRRMFPYCRYRLSGLNPNQMYSLFLSMAPWDENRYRWNKNKWEVIGKAERQFKALIRMFPHHNSPALGSHWMKNLVSFYKLKLTNNVLDEEKEHILLYSLQRYIPKLHVIPVLQGVDPGAPRIMFVAAESMTFTFPQTSFMAVTYYQNVRITQLKIHFNPFARGFKDNFIGACSPMVKMELKTAKEADAAQGPSNPDEMSAEEEEVEDLSMMSCNDSPPLSNAQETRLVPFMSNPDAKEESYTPCSGGRYTLGELVLVEKSPPLEKKQDDAPASVFPEPRRDSDSCTSPKMRSGTSTPKTSPGHRKRRKISRRWTKFQGRERKVLPAAVRSSSVTGCLQPETDDVEGLLFVSFTSKEALEVHIKNRPAAAVVPSTVTQSEETMEVKPEADDDKISRLQSVLLSDLRVFKHRQVIHPVLQEVGMKLSSLDPTKSIDLQYLGVALPLPPPNGSEETLVSARNKGLPFISRTGKTSDMTKIKGWKSKFMTSSESPLSNGDGLQKNLSAFCSNMLDKYLESEAQQITERAAAFSTEPEGSVTYQLPERSSSYVKTLDSALAHRNAASNRPCPLSHKSLLYSALTSAPPSPDGTKFSGDQIRRKSTSEQDRPASESALTASDASHSLSASNSLPSQNPAASFMQSQRTSGLNKSHFRLWEMEMGALNQGLSRTRLAPDRVSVALSTLATKQTESGRPLKACVKKLPPGSNCKKAHCRLGCVCPSEEHPSRDRVHCRQPECMLDCSCSRHNATEQTAEGGSEQSHINPVSSVTNTEHVVRPRPGSRTNTLWNRNAQEDDSEPLFIPKSSISVPEDSREPPHIPQVQEDKRNPINEYLESMMTCARVRGVSPRPPRQAHAQPQIVTTPEPTSPERPSNAQPQKNHSSGPERPPQRTPVEEMEAKKQIQIQSLCPWQDDRQMILEALCSRMTQNRLCKRFHVGPYCINPIDKISMRKPSGAVISYRIQIGVRSEDSEDEDDLDESELIEEDYPEARDLFLGVTPFLTRVTPAGRLRVMKKSSKSQEQGLVQVNGKGYNQAKLMLGSMGSLHPANRLAAFVTGRLKLPRVFQKIKPKPDSTRQPTAPEILHAKAADPVASPTTAAMDLKTLKQPHGQLIQPDVLRNGSSTSSQNSQSHSSASSQQLVAGPLQSGSASSPIFLTVSPALKSPSFLEQSGTYSFRICPPTHESFSRPTKPPAVSLPGGFTLLQLPQPGAKGAARKAAPPNAAAKAATQPRERIGQFCGNSQDKIGNLLSNKSELSSSCGMIVDESDDDEDDEADQLSDSHSSSQSDDSTTSSSSDYSDSDEDDELLDVESLEEGCVSMRTSRLRGSCGLKTCHSRNRCLHAIHKTMPDVNKRRDNHTAVERARRQEQCALFEKLGNTLRCEPRTARQTILKQAVVEIQNLEKTSKALMQKRKMLATMQYLQLKRLSALSGKSPAQIKTKLMEICERQKKKASNVRYFSNMLQSRALNLQVSAPRSDPEPSPPVKEEGEIPSPAYTPTVPAHDNRSNMLVKLKPHLYKALTDSYGKTNAPQPASSVASVEPGEVLDLSQASRRRLNPEVRQEPTPSPNPGATSEQTRSSDITKVSGAPTLEAPAQSSASKKPENNFQGPPPKTVTLPLVRTKNGRLILPSCLKPLGNGLYRLMVMKSKSKEEGANTPTESQQPVESETSSVLKDKASSSNLNPKPSGASDPPCEMITLFQPIPAPAVDPAAHGNNTSLPASADTNQIPPATRIRFRVGRPRKHAAETKAPGSLQSGETKRKRNAHGDVAEGPVPAKRRGRPSRSPPAQAKKAGRPPRARTGVERFDQSFRSPPSTKKELKGTRPLTRASLGKDFPSAKKRSWIDLEKELESDADNE